MLLEREKVSGDLEGTLVANGSKCLYVLGLVSEADQLNSERGMAAKVVSGITDERAILQGAGADLESKGLRQAEHIRAGDFKYAARACGDNGGVGIAARWCGSFAAATGPNLLDLETTP